MRETTIQDLEKKTTLECYMTGFNDGQKEARDEDQKKQVKICKKCIHSGKNKNTEQEKELLDLFNKTSKYKHVR